MVELRNHTPHRIVIERDGTVPIVLDPVTPLPRVVVTRTPNGSLHTSDGTVPLVSVEVTGAVVDLPPAGPGRLLVVARAVAEAAAHRSDLLFPDGLVRDGRGRVIACRTLATVGQRGRGDTPHA